MIKVLVPSLPTADELLPYLREIDANRVYVNQGPLLRRLEAELGAMVGNPCRVVANGTLSLELTLKALNIPRGFQVLVPAVTYVASAQAIVNAGLRPVLCDVDSVTWQITPKIAAAALPYCPKLAAVMPVATYGAPVPIEPWERFHEETALPIVIDAAGAIYGQQASKSQGIAISYSLHATKALGAGEGGVVATANAELLERVESLANFGPGGTNAKMSEYHAAVGLASLARGCDDAWRGRVWHWYANHIADVFRHVTPRAATLFPVLLPNPSAAAVAFSLATRSIEAKQWYRPFLDERAEFAACMRVRDLDVTGVLRRHCIGLPWHEFLTEDDVRRVCHVLGGLI